MNNTLKHCIAICLVGLLLAPSSVAAQTPTPTPAVSNEAQGPDEAAGDGDDDGDVIAVVIAGIAALAAVVSAVFAFSQLQSAKRSAAAAESSSAEARRQAQAAEKSVLEAGRQAGAAEDSVVEARNAVATAERARLDAVRAFVIDVPLGGGTEPKVVDGVPETDSSGAPVLWDRGSVGSTFDLMMSRVWVLEVPVRNMGRGVAILRRCVLERDGHSQEVMLDRPLPPGEMTRLKVELAMTHPLHPDHGVGLPSLFVHYDSELNGGVGETEIPIVVFKRSTNDCPAYSQAARIVA